MYKHQLGHRFNILLYHVLLKFHMCVSVQVEAHDSFMYMCYHLCVLLSLNVKRITTYPFICTWGYKLYEMIASSYTLCSYQLALL